MKRLRKRWLAWKSIDDGSSAAGAESREARLDALLRSGAARELEHGEGRLRWRVFEAITSKRAASGDTRRWRLGVLERRGPALAACVVLVAGIGLTWLAAPQPSRPIPSIVAPQSPIAEGVEGSDIGGAAEGGGIGEFVRRAVTLGPTAAIAASIDSSYHRERERVLGEARTLASSFARRVAAPIAALNRGVQNGAGENTIEAPRPGGGGV